MAIRLAVISSHPVQYYAPLFRRLGAGEEIDLRVFYGWTGSTEESYDHGFKKDVEWDVPLLDGYDYAFVPNTSNDPGTHHFRGLVNPKLLPSIDRWGPDALLVFGWSWKSHLRALRHFSGRVPVLFRGDSTLIDEQPGIRKLVRRAALRWVYRHVDMALYVGVNNRAYFKAHGLRDEQLHWVPHAVDNDRFADPDGRMEENARAWRREIGIPPEAPTLVFAGKLSRKKGPGLLLRAFERMDAPEAHLVVAGSGPLEDELRRGAPENAHFLGFQNQSRMPVVYRLGDVFVMPSRGPGETWGLAVNEAMACGRAVVASTKVGCVPDLVDGGANGFVFESGSEAALATKLQTLLDHADLRGRMGKASLRRIRNWSMERAAQRLKAAIETRGRVTAKPDEPSL